MALETVGKPRLRQVEELVPGVSWYRVSAEKTNGSRTSLAVGFGRTPESAWEAFKIHDPFAFDAFDDDCPF